MSGGYDTMDRAIAVALVTGGIILLPGGFFTYNLYQRLGTSQAEVETMQADADQLKRQLQEASSKLEESQAEVESIQSELDTTKRDLENVQGNLTDREKVLQKQAQDLETLATCLSGVVEALTLLDRGDNANALIMLGRVESSCEKSDEIIESLSSSKTSDLPVTTS